MYASVKNYNIQKYEKAGDDEGDLLPFLNNPFSAYSVLPFEDWVVVKKKIDKVRLGSHGEPPYCQKRSEIAKSELK